VFSPEAIVAASRAVVPDPPNLKNTVLAHDNAPRPELDLNELDRLN